MESAFETEKGNWQNECLLCIWRVMRIFPKDKWHRQVLQWFFEHRATSLYRRCTYKKTVGTHERRAIGRVCGSGYQALDVEKHLSHIRRYPAVFRLRYRIFAYPTMAAAVVLFSLYPHLQNGWRCSTPTRFCVKNTQRSKHYVCPTCTITASKITALGGDENWIELVKTGMGTYEENRRHRKRFFPASCTAKDLSNYSNRSDQPTSD